MRKFVLGEHTLPRLYESYGQTHQHEHDTDLATQGGPDHDDDRAGGRPDHHGGAGGARDVRARRALGAEPHRQGLADKAADHAQRQDVDDEADAEDAEAELLTERAITTVAATLVNPDRA